MLLLIAAAIAASGLDKASDQPMRPLVQATASVRILSGVRLHLDGQATKDAPAPRDTVIQSATGKQSARLIEFQ
jgi:hypothetical protein